MKLCMKEWSPVTIQLVHYLHLDHRIVLGFCLSLTPDVPILDSSNSMANKDMMSKVWTNRDTVIRVETLWEKEKLLVMSNFSFFHCVIKTICC